MNKYFYIKSEKKTGNDTNSAKQDFLSDVNEQKDDLFAKKEEGYTAIIYRNSGYNVLGFIDLTASNSADDLQSNSKLLNERVEAISSSGGSNSGGSSPSISNIPNEAFVVLNDTTIVNLSRGRNFKVDGSTSEDGTLMLSGGVEGQSGVIIIEDASRIHSFSPNAQFLNGVPTVLSGKEIFTYIVESSSSIIMGRLV